MKKLILIITFAISLTVIMGGQKSLAFNPNDKICNSGATGTANSAICQTTPNSTNSPLTGPDGIITKVIKLLTILVGIVAVIMIIVAGLMYVTSGGDSQKIDRAKNTILYAVIGLVVASMAQIIIYFVVDRTTTAGGITSSSQIFPGQSVAELGYNDATSS